MKRTISYLIFLLLFLGSLQSCKNQSDTIKFCAKNNLDLARANETIILNVNDILSKSSSLALDQLVVVEKKSGLELVSQLIDYNLDGQFEELIFQTDFEPNQTKSFYLQQKAKQDSILASKVYAKFVPERKDDFAWENDRIAFRMYGPALQAGGEISSGVDVWVKSVPDLILDKWYQPGNNYHVDHGEGLDYYKVGPSLGCGGTALWDDGELVPSKNFTKWKILANGPIRTIFELTYAAWNFKGNKIWEVKRISLDAGQNLNRFESTYFTDDLSAKLPFGIGIVKREGAGKIKIDKDKGWMGYWEPEHDKNGCTGCGVVLFPQQITELLETDSHYLILSDAIPAEPVVYYAGAGWSKSGDFTDHESWNTYLNNYAACQQNPIEIQF